MVVGQAKMRRRAAIRRETARVVRAGVVNARTQRDERAQAARSANAEIAEDVVFAADRQVGAGIGRVERLAILDLITLDCSRSAAEDRASNPRPTALSRLVGSPVCAIAGLLLLVELQGDDRCGVVP